MPLSKTVPNPEIFYKPADPWLANHIRERLNAHGAESLSGFYFNN
jgi:hypothetical protein